jgi:hypothetical protein
MILERSKRSRLRFVMKPPNYMSVLATICSVTVHLLTVSGKKEFAKDWAGFAVARCLMDMESTKPPSIGLGIDKKTAVYQDDVTAVSTA